jgi:hypothetical protein
MDKSFAKYIIRHQLSEDEMGEKRGTLRRNEKVMQNVIPDI